MAPGRIAALAFTERGWWYQYVPPVAARKLLLMCRSAPVVQRARRILNYYTLQTLIGCLTRQHKLVTPVLCCYLQL